MTIQEKDIYNWIRMTPKQRKEREELDQAWLNWKKELDTGYQDYWYDFAWMTAVKLRFTVGYDLFTFENCKYGGIHANTTCECI